MTVPEEYDIDAFFQELDGSAEQKEYPKEAERPSLPEISIDELHKESEPIGHGKFGTVFRGKLWDKTVAIKQYQYTHDYEHEKSIFRHVRVNSCANIIKPIGLCGGLLVTEFCSAGSGDKLLYAKETNNVRDTVYMADMVDILMDVCNAMICLHSMGVVHRDLSARNLLFVPSSPAAHSSKKFIVKLCDFGEAEINKSRIASRKGPYLWLAPESIRHQVCNARTDIYAFGILCYELLVGTRPLPSTAVEVAVMEILCLSMRPNINDYKRLIPLPLIILVQQCWQQIVDYRPSAFGSILNQLSALRSAMGTSPSDLKTACQNVTLSQIKFVSKRSKEMVKDLQHLISMYFSNIESDTDDGWVEYKTKTKQEFVKQIFEYQLQEKTDLQAIEYYINYFPWFEEKNVDKKAESIGNVSSFSKQFGIKLNFDVKTEQD